MNWRWKHIIICGVIGLVVGIVMAVSLSSLIEEAVAAGETGLGIGTQIALVLVMPISINFLYWGWKKGGEILRSMNLFLVMSIGKWLIFLMVRFIISTFIGYVMFPIAIYKAIKNAA